MPARQEIPARNEYDQFTKRMKREISFKLFPHLNGEADHGYPFKDREGMFKARLDLAIGLRKMMCDLDQATRQMPEAEGRAFHYLALRDLQERAAMHIHFTQQRAVRLEIAAPVAQAA